MLVPSIAVEASVTVSPAFAPVWISNVHPCLPWWKQRVAVELGVGQHLSICSVSAVTSACIESRS